MRSIMIHADADEGLAGRLQAGTDLARAFDAHLTCLQAIPFTGYVVTDPFGGAYAMSELAEALRERNAANRARVEKKLSGEGVRWTWREATGLSAQALLAAGHLADLILVSLPSRDSDDQKLTISAIGDVIVHGHTPVLALPPGASGFNPFKPVAVAWNGSAESSHALRAALPLLKKAADIHIVTVEEAREQEDIFPATAACEYLGWHGLEPMLHLVRPDGRSIADTLSAAALEHGASCLVMGAYGHSRFREAVLGGTTRELLSQDGLPLLLGR